MFGIVINRAQCVGLVMGTDVQGRILKASYMYVLLYVHTCMRMYTLLCIYVCTVYALYTCVVCVWCCVYCHSETTAHLMVLGVLSDHITEQ